MGSIMIDHLSPSGTIKGLDEGFKAILAVIPYPLRSRFSQAFAAGFHTRILHISLKQSP